MILWIAYKKLSIFLEIRKRKTYWGILEITKKMLLNSFVWLSNFIFNLFEVLKTFGSMFKFNCLFFVTNEINNFYRCFSVEFKCSYHYVSQVHEFVIRFQTNLHFTFYELKFQWLIGNIRWADSVCHWTIIIFDTIFAEYLWKTHDLLYISSQRHLYVRQTFASRMASSASAKRRPIQVLRPYPNGRLTYRCISSW